MYVYVCVYMYLYVCCVCVGMCVYVIKTSFKHVGAQQFVQPLLRVGEMCAVYVCVYICVYVYKCGMWSVYVF